MSTKLNNDIMALDDWFRANKLSSNTTKTFAMIFKGSRAPPVQLSVQINGIDIEMVSKAKFLGIIIDDNLSWRPYIDHVKNKTTSRFLVPAYPRPRLIIIMMCNLFYSCCTHTLCSSSSC